MVQVLDVMRAGADVRQPPRRVRRRVVQQVLPLRLSQRAQNGERVMADAQVLFHERPLELCFGILSWGFESFGHTAQESESGANRDASYCASFARAAATAVSTAVLASDTGR